MLKELGNMNQIVNDIEVEIIHNGEGEIYAVTHQLNAERFSEIEKFVK